MHAWAEHVNSLQKDPSPDFEVWTHLLLRYPSVKSKIKIYARFLCAFCKHLEWWGLSAIREDSLYCSPMRAADQKRHHLTLNPRDLVRFCTCNLFGHNFNEHWPLNMKKSSNGCSHFYFSILCSCLYYTPLIHFKATNKNHTLRHFEVKPGLWKSWRTYLFFHELLKEVTKTSEEDTEGNFLL